MRKALVNMAVRLGAVCDLTTGQASLQHATAAHILPTRSRAVHALARAKLGRELKTPSVNLAAHKASAASISGRPTQTRAYSAPYGFEQEPSVGYEVTTIPWDPMAANAVSLIGNTGNDIELKHLQTGRTLGQVRLACSHKAGETTWYDITFWGPMAERVAAQVPKGSKVCIQGKLSPSSWINREGVKQTKFQITANTIRFVEKYDSVAAQPGGQSQIQSEQPQAWGASASGQDSSFAQGSEWGAASSSLPLQQSAPQATVTKESTPDQKWKSVFETPNLWWDNTSSKRNPRAPDFKLKNDPTGMVALWIDSYDTPAWVKDQLEKSGIMSLQPSTFTDMN